MEDAENFINQNLNLSVPEPVILLLSLEVILKSLYGNDLAKSKTLVCVCYSCFYHLCFNELTLRLSISSCNTLSCINNVNTIQMVNI